MLFNTYSVYSGANTTTEKVTLFTCTQGAAVAVINCIFEQVDFQIVSCQQCSIFNVTNTTFQNIATNSIMKFTGVYPSQGLVLFRGSSFLNISIHHSLIEIGSDGVQLSIINTIMQNISKNVVAKADDIVYNTQYTGGLCCLATEDVLVTVNNSRFINIGSHCFGLTQSVLSIEHSIFDNTGLEYTETDLSLASVGSLTVNSGNSWINVQDTSSLITGASLLKLGYNRFLNNKMRPLYGGVIFKLILYFYLFQ